MGGRTNISTKYGGKKAKSQTAREKSRSGAKPPSSRKKPDHSHGHGQRVPAAASGTALHVTNGSPRTGPPRRTPPSRPRTTPPPPPRGCCAARGCSRWHGGSRRRCRPKDAIGSCRTRGAGGQTRTRMRWEREHRWTVMPAPPVPPPPLRTPCEPHVRARVTRPAAAASARSAYGATVRAPAASRG